MDKKSQAKSAMLKKLSAMMGDERHEDLGNGLKSKKMSKVTVMAPDKAGLVKGLSKAEQILKAKGLDSDDESEESEESDEEYESCPACEGHGCAECSEEEAE